VKDRRILVYSYAGRKVSEVMEVRSPTVNYPPLSISTDGAEALVTQDDGGLPQIMLVKNFP